MVRDFMCAFGNCEVRLPAVRCVLIRDTDGDQRRFCCLEHAGLWALRYALRRDSGPVQVFQDRVRMELKL